MSAYYSDEHVTLHHGDSLEILPTLDVSADVLLTDPPYFKVKQDEWDNQWDKASEFLGWMGQWLDHTKPLLAPHASVWVFASPQLNNQVERLVAERFRVLNSIRWAKLGGDNLRRVSLPSMRSFVSIWEGIIFAEQPAQALASADYENRKRVFQPAGDRLAQARQGAGLTRADVAPHMLHLYRNIDTVKAMLSDWEIGKSNVAPAAHATMATLYGSDLPPYGWFVAEYERLQREYDEQRRPFKITDRKLSEDIWHFHSVAKYPGKHPCEKPQDMLTHMIETSSRPGWTILDPFAGSGSTLLAARNAGRKAIGIEKDEAWCEKIAQRLSAQKEPDLFDLLEVAA